jgi:hypothetical protein
VSGAKLRDSTTVFLVGNIEPTMEWYKKLGFNAEYYPPGFAILRRDAIQIFLQQQPGYVGPDDPGRRERDAWNVYIITDNVKALYEEFSGLPGVNVSRQLCPQDYGMMEFDVIDLNGPAWCLHSPYRAGRSSTGDNRDSNATPDCNPNHNQRTEQHQPNPKCQVVGRARSSMQHGPNRLSDIPKQ